MKWDSLPLSTSTALRLISTLDEVSPFILIGGTAIALQIGHRISEDLDFITLKDRLDHSEINTFLIATGFRFRSVPHDVMTILDFEDNGFDINDFHQDYTLITPSGSVKITFAVAERNKDAITRSSETKIGKLRYSPLETLFELKVLALSFRHKKRDIFDLKCLIKTNIGSISTLFEIAAKSGAYIPAIEAKLISWPANDLLSISFKDKQIDEQLIEREVISFFEKQLENFNLNLLQNTGYDQEPG